MQELPKERTSHYMFYSTKNYGADRGFSCCFRQWKATHSHCSKLHGYSLGFKFVFQSETLDHNNWVFDFGNYGAIKAWLTYMFDHTLLVAENDPEILMFRSLSAKGLCDLREVNSVGCEMFAKMTYEKVSGILACFQAGKTVAVGDVEYASKYRIPETVHLKSVEVYEHAGNSAVYEES